MWGKLFLAALFALMLAGAYHFAPAGGDSSVGGDDDGDPSNAVRIITWNLGYADLEPDTRAQTKDLPAVAEAVLRRDPDAVALQELTGEAQLRELLRLLGGRYRGAIARSGEGDRFEAVLVKDPAARFAEVPAGRRRALAATFRTRPGAREVVLLSAHADAFNAARRRSYTEAVVEWAGGRAGGAAVFVAGDFNFELRAAEETNLYTDDLKHDGQAYSLLLRHFADLGRAAGDTAINDRRIDYVFGPREGARPRRAEVLRGAAVGRMDHWPLLVEVAL
jgi:endonuclease/exonuclease/phosphatase family metal-dependent hydrolase